MKPKQDFFMIILRRIIVFALRFIIATASAIIVASWAIPAGAAQRGYDAVGGEYLLILVAWVLGFWASGAIFERSR
jgi:hypothetical protein